MGRFPASGSHMWLPSPPQGMGFIPGVDWQFVQRATVCQHQMLLSALRAALHSQVCSESEQVREQHVTLSMLILAEGGVAKACPALGSHSLLLSSQSLFHENEMGGGTFGKRKGSRECQEVNVALKPFFFKVENLDMLWIEGQTQKQTTTKKNH